MVGSLGKSSVPTQVSVFFTPLSFQSEQLFVCLSPDYYNPGEFNLGLLTRKTKIYPLKFEPVLKQTLWEGDKIVPFKHLNLDLKGVGEGWEISGIEDNEPVVTSGPDKGLTLASVVRKHREEPVGEADHIRFGNKSPLLIKLIDTKQDLSIQVYPADNLAKKRHNLVGKTETWYVVGADKGAKLCSGFPEQITPKEHKKHVPNNMITDVLQEYEIKPGDVFLFPAGHVYSIGAGASTTEVQQTSDIIHRIYDFSHKDASGETRGLHIGLAREAINYEALDDCRAKYEAVKNESVELVTCPYFTISVYDMTEEISCDHSELDSFVIFIYIEGVYKIKDNEGNGLKVGTGKSILPLVITQDVTITPEAGNVKLLETYV